MALTRNANKTMETEVNPTVRLSKQERNPGDRIEQNQSAENLNNVQGGSEEDPVEYDSAYWVKELGKRGRNRTRAFQTRIIEKKCGEAREKSDINQSLKFEADGALPSGGIRDPNQLR